MSEEKPQKVVFEISLSSVLKVLLLLVAIWIAYLLKDVLILLLVVAIITIALEPFVHKLSDQGVPRGLSVIVLYLALFSILGIMVYFLIPPITNQIKELALNFPYYASKFSEINLGSNTLTLNKILGDFATKLSSLTGNMVTGVVSIFGGFVSAVMILALTYYALVDTKGIKAMVVKILPVEQKDKFREAMDKVSAKLSDWMSGQISLMVIIGVIDWLALLILGIPYALVLGLIAGLLEIVPVIGPIIAGAVAVLIALVASVSFWKILVIVAIYTLVQQIENHILVPKIMQKAVGLSPLIVIIAILIGSKLLGAGGAILAVPIAAGIQVFLDEYTGLNSKKT